MSITKLSKELLKSKIQQYQDTIQQIRRLNNNLKQQRANCQHLLSQKDSEIQEGSLWSIIEHYQQFTRSRLFSLLLPNYANQEQTKYNEHRNSTRQAEIQKQYLHYSQMRIQSIGIIQAKLLKCNHFTCANHQPLKISFFKPLGLQAWIKQLLQKKRNRYKNLWDRLQNIHGKRSPQEIRSISENFVRLFPFIVQFNKQEAEYYKKGQRLVVSIVSEQEQEQTQFDLCYSQKNRSSRRYKNDQMIMVSDKSGAEGSRVLFKDLVKDLQGKITLNKKKKFQKYLSKFKPVKIYQSEAQCNQIEIKSEQLSVQYLKRLPFDQLQKYMEGVYIQSLEKAKLKQQRQKTKKPIIQDTCLPQNIRIFQVLNQSQVLNQGSLGRENQEIKEQLNQVNKKMGIIVSPPRQHSLKAEGTTNMTIIPKNLTDKSQRINNLPNVRIKRIVQEEEDQSSSEKGKNLFARQNIQPSTRRQKESEKTTNAIERVQQRSQFTFKNNQTGIRVANIQNGSDHFNQAYESDKELTLPVSINRTRSLNSIIQAPQTLKARNSMNSFPVIGSAQKLIPFVPAPVTYSSKQQVANSQTPIQNTQQKQINPKKQNRAQPKMEQIRQKMSEDSKSKSQESSNNIFNMRDSKDSLKSSEFNPNSWFLNKPQIGTALRHQSLQQQPKGYKNQNSNLFGNSPTNPLNILSKVSNLGRTNSFQAPNIKTEGNIHSAQQNISFGPNKFLNRKELQQMKNGQLKNQGQNARNPQTPKLDSLVNQLQKKQDRKGENIQFQQNKQEHKNQQNKEKQQTRPQNESRNQPLGFNLLKNNPQGRQNTNFSTETKNSRNFDSQIANAAFQMAGGFCNNQQNASNGKILRNNQNNVGTNIFTNIVGSNNGNNVVEPQNNIFLSNTGSSNGSSFSSGYFASQINQNKHIARKQNINQNERQNTGLNQNQYHYNSNSNSNSNTSSNNNPFSFGRQQSQSLNPFAVNKSQSVNPFAVINSQPASNGQQPSSLFNHLSANIFSHIDNQQKNQFNIFNSGVPNQGNMMQMRDPNNRQ